MEDNITARSPFTRILSNPTRVKLLDVLLARGSLAADADRLKTLAGVQGEISHHMEVLIRANLAEVTEDGDYRLADTNEAQVLGAYHLVSYDNSMDDVIDATEPDGSMTQTETEEL